MRALLPALFVVGLVLGVALSPCLPAQAAPEREGQAADQKRAAAHFERGVEFYREGSLDAAFVEFERAYELIPSVRLLFNLAQIQAERHDYAAALVLFERYTRSDDREIPEARRAEAQQEVVRLRARVAYLWVSSDVSGAQLFVDDAPVAQLPMSEALAINPGVCNVRLEKPGYQPALSVLKVAAGEHPRLQLRLLPATSAASSEMASPSATGDAHRETSAADQASFTPFWVASGATLALGAATLGLGLTAREADRDLSRALDQVPADPAKTTDARSDLKLYSALTDTCAALAAVGLGLSIYFLVKPLRARAASRQATAGRTMQVFPGHRGVALRATF
jgi:tetratricopeptide (TPR) repeat protein